MHDTPIGQHPSQKPAPGQLADIFLLHATVLEVSIGTNPADDASLGKLVRRRLSRLERVLATHGGSLIRQMPQGLVVTFDTAETAVLVAAEMQRRCAAIPQIQATRIGLQIGIHAATPGLEDEAVEAEQSWLAALPGEDSIALSAKTMEALPETLRTKTSALIREHVDMGCHLVDWAAMPMPPTPVTAPGNRTVPPVKTISDRRPRLTLRQGDRSYSFGAEKSVISIGRDPTNDVVITTGKASRRHCQIVYRLDYPVLIDLSLNGTYVKSGDKPEEAVRKSMLPLTESGKIGFGHSCKVDTGQVFEFEICRFQTTSADKI